MKLIKNTAIALIFCLAAYGAFMLLKPAARLVVSDEERNALKEEFGFEIHSNESENGRAAILNNVVGAPPIKRKSGSGSSTSKVPTSLGGTHPSGDGAPAFGAPAATAPATVAPPFASEAPAFGAPATVAPPFAASKDSEAPAFGAPTTVAPPFAASKNSEAPAFIAASSQLPSPPRAAMVEPAPVYGSQVTVPSIPIHQSPKPTPQIPVAPPVPAVPVDPQPAPSAEVPVAATSDPASLALALAQSFEPSPAPKAAPVIPGPQSRQESAVKPWEIPAATNVVQSPQPPQSTPIIQPQVSPPPAPTELKDAVTFVPPQLRRLPKVAEDPTPPPVPVSMEPPRRETVSSNGFMTPNYQQASIRRPFQEPTPDAAPVVSFSTTPQHPEKPTEKPMESKTAHPLASLTGQPVPAVTVPAATVPAASVPKNEPAPKIAAVPEVAVQEASPQPVLAIPSESLQAKQELIESQKALFVSPTTVSNHMPQHQASPLPPSTATPFAVENPISPQPAKAYKTVVAIPPTPATLHPEVREPVARFVVSQCDLIGSGESDKIRAAFIQLSRLYDHPELNEFERAYLTPILDRLAVDIIFSRKNHILEEPYIVKAGETAYTFRSGETVFVPLGNSIDSIAATFNLTPELLMKINGLTNKRPLETGMPLKVVLGHFDAKVSTERRDFVLVLGGLYAGRFPIGVGEDIQNVRGDFSVSLKRETPQGRSLTLSNGISICGVDRPQPGDSLRSSFRLSERDATELFDILSEKSVVVIEK